jgi:hypothetical protein
MVKTCTQIELVIAIMDPDAIVKIILSALYKDVKTTKKPNKSTCMILLI